MFQYKFARPSVTATLFVVHPTDGKFLVGIRGDDSDAFPGYMCLPGGFLNPKITDEDMRNSEHELHPGETVDTTAIRELYEESNIRVDEEQLQLFQVYSDPETDPRGHIVNIVYFAFPTVEQVENAKAGDDLKSIEWIRASKFEDYNFAFNHLDIIIDACKYIVNQQQYIYQ